MEYPFSQLGSALLAVPPTSFLCTPRLLAGGTGWEADKSSMLWCCVNTAQQELYTVYQ